MKPNSLKSELAFRFYAAITLHFWILKFDMEPGLEVEKGQKLRNQAEQCTGKCFIVLINLVSKRLIWNPGLCETNACTRAWHYIDIDDISQANSRWKTTKCLHQLVVPRWIQVGMATLMHLALMFLQIPIVRHATSSWVTCVQTQAGQCLMPIPSWSKIPLVATE